MASKNSQSKALKFVPFLPSVLTMGSIVCGVAAILRVSNISSATVVEMETFLVQACWLIFAAMLLDLMDGKVARAMDAVSEFGQEIDSIADAISFGVAPAFIANRFIVYFLLQHKDVMKREFMLLAGVAIVYVLCGAIRLARYNVEADGEAHGHLVGLPTPAAAGFIVANILFFVKYYEPLQTKAPAYLYVYQALFPFGLLAAALLMVSRIKFIHIGHMLTKRLHQLSFMVLFLFLVLIVVWKPTEFFFMFIWGYMLWGLIPGLIRYGRVLIRKKGKLTQDLDELDDE